MFVKLLETLDVSSSFFCLVPDIFRPSENMILTCISACYKCLKWQAPWAKPEAV